MSESVEVEPAVASLIFGDNIAKVRKYTELLVRDGDLLGLLGPRELPKLWTRHVLNSAVVAEMLPREGVSVADIGSGAGLPGIPMAIIAPESHFTLIEPMERRAEWLKAIVQELGLGNVTVVRARAEEVRSEKFDVVTARAVAALSKLLRMAVPLCKPGGRILALKGQKAAEEMEDAEKLYKKMRISSSQIIYAGSAHLVEPTLVVETRLL
jgi:16S rRNA (guanine527-N7)-methyltransferase